MGKKRYLAMGIAMGMIITTGIQAYASDAADTVAAYIRNQFKIEYNNEAQTIPSDYNVLVYNDRTYLPLRYVSDLLGCGIDWNGDTQTISITKEEASKPADTTTPSGVIDTTSYGTLPQTVETVDYSVTAYQLTADTNGDRLYIKVKNKTDDKIIRLDQSSLVYTIDGKEYPYSSVNSIYKDSRWYTAYIDSDSEAEGYITFPSGLKNISNVKIAFNLTMDGTTAPIPVSLNVNVSK